MGLFGKMWNKFHVSIFVNACKYNDEPQVLSMKNLNSPTQKIKKKYRLYSMQSRTVITKSQKYC
jgi:hypothetical protein